MPSTINYKELEEGRPRRESAFEQMQRSGFEIESSRDIDYVALEEGQPRRQPAQEFGFSRFWRRYVPLAILGLGATAGVAALFTRSTSSHTSDESPLEGVSHGSGDLSVTFENMNDSPAYILIKGTNPETHRVSFIDKNGGYHDVEFGMSSSDYTYSIDDLNKEDGKSVMHMPYLSSGRIYFSYGEPLHDFGIVKDADGVTQVADPSVYNPTDSNFGTLFDKVEFTYTTSGYTWINPTAVDFVSMPLSITQNDKTYGLTVSQDTLFNTMTTAFEGSPEYSALIKTQEDGTLLRILAPGRDDSSFPSDYLDPMIDSYWDHYTKNQLTVDCAEVRSSDPSFTGTVNADGVLVLKNSQGWQDDPSSLSCTTGQNEVCIGKPSSDEFFQAAGSHLQNLGNAPISIVSKFMSAAWAAGLLPTDVLSNQFFSENRDNYFQSGSYDQYDAALHTNNLGIFYAFAYDDVLGIDGTNAATDEHDVSITLQPMQG